MGKHYIPGTIAGQANPITFTRQALERATFAQHQALVALARQYDADSIEVTTDFSLPKGYVAFVINYSAQRYALYGGISATGAVST